MHAIVQNHVEQSTTFLSRLFIQFDSLCKDYCIEELNKNKSRSCVVSRDVFAWLGFSLGKVLVDFFFSEGRLWVLTTSNSHLIVLFFLAIESTLELFTVTHSGKHVFHRDPGWHPTARNEKGRAWMQQWRTL